MRRLLGGAQRDSQQSVSQALYRNHAVTLDALRLSFEEQKSRAMENAWEDAESVTQERYNSLKELRQV